MSWFDATGFASLAKTALKEAQKTIDKALDIKDEEGDASGTRPSGSEASDSIASDVIDASAPKKSSSNPILATVGSATAANNLWDSFTGTFFDAAAKDKTPDTAVTVAPTISNATLPANASAPLATNASESVETLNSPVTTPTSTCKFFSLSNSKMSLR